MAWEERLSGPSLPHTLSLTDRGRLTVSGVADVESFDENTVVLDTAGGLLIVRGSSLHVDKLSIEGGELSLSGRVDSLNYEEGRAERGGLLSRLFG